MTEKYAVEIAGETFEVTVGDESSLLVSTRGRNRTFLVDERGCPGRLVVAGGKRTTPAVIESGRNGMTVRIGCREISVTVKTERDILRERLQPPEKSHDLQGKIVSPLPGLVAKIAAREGTAVKKGESVVIIEAMKMENEIKAPGDCIIREIRVSEGQTVHKGQTLAVFA